MKRNGGFLFLLFVTATLMGCSSLLYYPTRALYIDPKKLSPPPVENVVQVGDIEVHGWTLSPEAPPKTTLVFFHGNGANRSGHVVPLLPLIREGHEINTFDYPGYGQTKGQPTPENTVRTAMEVIRFVKRKRPNTPLVVYGQSLGGAIAQRAVWELRNEIKPDLLVIDSSFTSYRSAARQMLGHSGITWLFQPIGWLVMSDAWAPGSRMNDMHGVPSIVIHSRQDEVINFALGEKVFKFMNEPKEFWIRESGSHNASFMGPDSLLPKLTDRLNSL